MHHTTPHRTTLPRIAPDTRYLLAWFQIEKIINELDDIGMMDNTLLVVASDNGGCPAEGGSNFPYRGFKHTLFEGGVRTQGVVYSKSDSIIPRKV